MTAYDYELKYRPGALMGHVDALSRCPLPECVADPADKLPLLALNFLNSCSDMSSQKVAAATLEDPCLKRICGWVLKGWPAGKMDSELQPYVSRQNELSVNFGVLMWGDRVVVPERLRSVVLSLLHESHQGIVRMKGLARGYFWWPGIDRSIQDQCAACSKCRETQSAPNKVKPLQWEKPRGPWSHLHIDFAGPVQGHTLLIVIDAYSKWVEIQIMRSTTSEAVICTLRRIFATHGIPDILVSDNGPQFTSYEFGRYLASIGVRHALTAPFNPQCNGLAERTVQTVKRAILKMTTPDWQERIDTFLAWQHITPGSTTGISPAEVLMGRKLRSPLDRAHPLYDPLREREGKRQRQIRELEKGARASARNYAPGPKWVDGTVTKQTSPRSYEIELDDGRHWRRHIDQLRPNASKEAHTGSRERSESVEQKWESKMLYENNKPNEIPPTACEEKQETGSGGSPEPEPTPGQQNQNGETIHIEDREEDGQQGCQNPGKDRDLEDLQELGRNRSI